MTQKHATPIDADTMHASLHAYTQIPDMQSSNQKMVNMWLSN